jgi:hypothetical protein
MVPPATLIGLAPPNTDAKITKKSTGSARVKNRDCPLRAKAARS